MLCIDSQIKDPYYNLAAEEYLLKTKDDDIFMLWQSDPVVVCGKHQNVLSEINYRFVRERNILVARRLTGGGTVFHDAGNVNFTFIRSGEAGKLINFSSFVNPVIRFLAEHGITAKEGSKHEILVNDRKISGNAEHVYKNRVLHHGTLLFNADLILLHQCIKRSGGLYIDKSVQSNRSTVMNLSELLNSLSQEDFKKELFHYIIRTMQGVTYDISETDHQAITDLACQKYRSWDWIYGWSPDYTYRNLWKCGAGEVTIEFTTHRGIIMLSAIHTTLKGIDATVLNSNLTGVKHQPQEIKRFLQETGLNALLENEELDDLMLAFF